MEEMEKIDPGDEEYWKMEDFKDCLKSNVSNGELSWIWRKGVNLGKKMVVTGVVVSSVSFVLPPLVALSAIGFIFSVPASFLIVTYACGEKLLNTLLPMPSTTPYEENKPMYSDGLEECRIYRGDVDKGYREDEEKEFEEDTRRGIEMRIDLAEEINKENNDYDQASANKDELDKRLSKVSEIVEEGGYEEDVGENMEDEEQPLDSKIIPEILEGIKEAENEISLLKKEEGGIPRDSLSAYIVEAQVDEENENNVEQVREGMAFVGRENEIIAEVGGYEEDVGEHRENENQPLNSEMTPNILEGIKEVGNEIPLMEKEEDVVLRNLSREVVVEGQVGGEEENNVKQTAEDMSFLGKEYVNNVEQVTEDMVSVDGEDENNIELVTEDVSFIGGEYESNVEQVTEDMVLVGGENENNVEHVGRYEEDVWEHMEDEEQSQNPKTVPEILEGVKDTENQFALMEKKEGGMPRNPLKASVVEAQVDGENENSFEQVTEDIAFVLPREVTEENEYRGNVTGLEEDELRRETTGLIEKMRDEGKNDQKRKESPAEEAISIIDTLLSSEGGEMADESGFDWSNNGTVETNQIADSFDKMPEGDDLSSNNEVEITVDYQEVLIVSSLSVSETAQDQGTTACSDKVKLEEEKIWEQLNAMRTIVGYKNTPHPSCAEELKALYVFTGVEPPASCNGPTDLADINEKLHFLMSIVGVK